MSTSCSLGGLELSLQQGFDSSPSTFFYWKSIILSTVPVSISRSTNRRNMCDVYKHSFSQPRNTGTLFHCHYEDLQPLSFFSRL